MVFVRSIFDFSKRISALKFFWQFGLDVLEVLGTLRFYPSNAAQRGTSAYSHCPCSCAKPAVKTNLDLGGGS